MEIRFQTGFELKNVIYKEKKNSFVEKSGTITKVKLVTKIEKHNQPYFRTLVLASYFYCEDNA